MVTPTSDGTLSLIFDEPNQIDNELCSPFTESCCADNFAKPIVPTIQGTPCMSSLPEPPSPAKKEADSDTTTYTFRWDVEVPLADRGKCGIKFMKQWKRVLQAQKLTPLVSAKLAPSEARFQLCLLGGGEAAFVAEREREIAEELAHLRRDQWIVAGEPARTHPAGWQGVRVWMTFARRDVETALAKKPKI